MCILSLWQNPGNPLINANAMELGMHLSVGTGVHTNDYLVPACAKGTPPAECTHTLSWEEPLKGMTPNAIGITINASLPYQVIQAYAACAETRTRAHPNKLLTAAASHRVPSYGLSECAHACLCACGS